MENMTIKDCAAKNCHMGGVVAYRRPFLKLGKKLLIAGGFYFTVSAVTSFSFRLTAFAFCISKL